jgi:23S rRNA U2552 (ribose-2'-O)-methylase RlmE/FtsJ
MNSYNINETIININENDIFLNENIYYINDTLKGYLHSIKSEIDKNLDLWEKNKKYLNPYEFINTNYDETNTCICSYKPISRAFFKMIEILYNFNFGFQKNIKSFHLAEGPGGFIEALSYFRKNKNDVYYGITLMDNANSNSVPKWSKADYFLSKNPNIIIENGADNTGNLYNKENLLYMTKYKNSIDFITADGGFDFSIDFNKQEENSLKLIFCEVCFALMLQKKGGSFVLKVFDLYTSASIQIIYLLNYLYEDVIITKPLSSRPANSEKYIICMKFKMVHNLNNILNKFIENYDNYKISNILNVALSNIFLEKINEINSIFGQCQIENIVNILNYMMDNNKYEKMEYNKKTHLNKCIKWCKKYNLPLYENYNQIL